MSRLPANVSRFTFEIVGLPDTLSVLSFSGQESLSSLYEYEVTVACERGDLAIDEMLHKNAALTLIDVEHPRVVHGVICMSQQLDMGDRFSRYRFSVVPKLWWLQHRSGYRIFQNQSIPNIVEQLLKEAGIKGNDLRIDLQGQYDNVPYCVQYGESEFDFIHRLLTDEGIHYSFQHHYAGHTLVLSDHNGIFKKIPGEAEIRYCQEDRTAKDQSVIFALQSQHQVTVNTASLSDYNFQKPNLRVHSKYGESSKNALNQLEQYQFRVQRSATKSEANKYQKMNIEQFQCSQKTIVSKTNDVRVGVGWRYFVVEHPNRSVNKAYYVYRSNISGELPQSMEAVSANAPSLYQCEAYSIPVDTRYRPKRNHTKPKIKGIQTAVVTGPANNEIYTDAMGRVKVQFHWDRDGQRDEKTSCWLRVSQTLAGKAWGSWMLPRVGQEVIVSFEEGDPDRPIITGSVYNGINKPPYPLPQYKSRTGLKTRSSEKGSGFNELSVEDQKGKEQIFIRAEKNADFRVKHDQKQWVGKDQHLTIGNHQFVDIGKDLHQRIGGDANLSVGQSLSFAVGKDVHLKVSGAHVTQVGNQLHIKGGARTTLQAGAQLSLAVGGSFISLDPSGVSIFGPIVRINEGGGAASANAASPLLPEKPIQPDDDNSGQIERPPANESPYLPGKIKFAEGKAQAITLKTAARSRAALVEFCPDCELNPLPIADEVKRENQTGKVSLPRESHAAKLRSNVTSPKSLEDAVNLLAAAREHIQKHGYVAKYTDEELRAMASDGEMPNERFVVRFSTAPKDRKKNEAIPPEENSGAIGHQRESGRHPLWMSTFDQVVNADTDPRIIADVFGTNFDPNTDYVLYVVDLGEDYELNGSDVFIPTFENMRKKLKSEFSDDLSPELIDQVMTEEYSLKFRKEWEDFNKELDEQGKHWSKCFETDEAEAFAAGLAEEDQALFITRQKILSEIGAWENFTGSGLTEMKSKPGKPGALETLEIQHNPESIQDMVKKGRVVEIPLKAVGSY